MAMITEEYLMRVLEEIQDAEKFVNVSRSRHFDAVSAAHKAADEIIRKHWGDADKVAVVLGNMVMTRVNGKTMLLEASYHDTCTNNEGSV